MRALVLLALLGTALAVPRSQQRIVGGSATTVEEYPYMSNMQYGLWGLWWSQACGGSLLTSTAVLSAAHCFIGDLPSDWQVVLGTSYASSGGTAYSVSSLINHAQYDALTVDYDVAIVRLASPAVFSNRVGVASIAGRSYNLPDNAIVTAIGWGRLSSNGVSPEQLQHVDINVINQQVCAERYGDLRSLLGFDSWPVVTGRMICAGILDVGGKDACQGDSGGPLAHNKNVIVGITSWGYGCAHEIYPGVNARVSVFTDWIIANAI